MTMNEEDLLKQIILKMVDNREKVSVTSNIDTTTTIPTVHFEVKVAYEDVGMVVGKGGMYANALRTIFSAIYGKIGKRVRLLVVNPRSKSS